MSSFRLVVLGGALCGLLAGCGAPERDPPRYPVRGTVLFNEAPVAEALVVFHPQTADDHTPRPLAQTDANGAYVLTTLQANDGAPAGEYRITVELRAPQQVGEELVREGADLLPLRYKRPEESGLTYTVKAGDNVVPPLRLTDR